METECHAWFDTNSKTSDETQTIHQTSNIQVLSLHNICLVSGNGLLRHNIVAMIKYGWME